MNIKEYIVVVEEIDGVLSLSMEFYLCLWSSIFVYGVLSMSTEFYLPTNALINELTKF